MKGSLFTASVRESIQHYMDGPDTPPLPHVTVVPPEDVGPNPTLDAIIAHVERQLTASSTPSKDATTITSHWLLCVPEPLRHDVEQVVSYLAMVVAIDFRHWTEEEGFCAQDGEPVRGLCAFYTMLPDTEAGNGASLHAETPRRPSEPVRLRGSAAMMYLLRRAVEEHNLHWYDPRFLLSLQERCGNKMEEMQQALSPCFLGCADDGITPRWMPATTERIQLLLSLAAALRGRSFYTLFAACGGYLFHPLSEDGGEGGFIHRLVHLHERYHDFASVPLCGGDCTTTLPILKLSQLTALALGDALPDLWRVQRANGMEVDRHSTAWLNDAARRCTHRNENDVSLSNTHLFLDHGRLFICCDYQIPRALQEAGLLRYDAHLVNQLTRNVLLRRDGPEEVSIRVGTLMSCQQLLKYLNARQQQRDAAKGRTSPRIVSVEVLDYALWYVGRYLPSSALNHHLCKTIMY